jgi:hypothetical protein
MLWILERKCCSLFSKIVVDPSRCPTCNIIFERINTSVILIVFMIDEFRLHGLVLDGGVGCRQRQPEGILQMKSLLLNDMVRPSDVPLHPTVWPRSCLCSA